LGAPRLVVVISTLVATTLVLPAAVTASPSVTPSSTTLSSSTASSTYDSWVTFTATVTGTGGTPTGDVTFTDTRNGSSPATVSLQGGQAIFTTAALAPGTRSIVAHYNGSTSFGPSSSGALDVSVTPVAPDALTYQGDPRHDGHQTEGSLSGSSLIKKWTVTLGETGGGLVGAGDVSYPVIARGRIFVTVENSQSYGTMLYALDARTGAIDWSVGLSGTYGFSALAYDGRRIFALNFDGLLTAFRAATGRELWASQMPGQYSFTAPPTAYDGIVYVAGAGSGGTVYAVTEDRGVLRWMQPVENGDKSSPAVDDSGLYVSYACQQDYRFDLSGQPVWHYSGSCEGGGGSTAVLHGNALYARGAYNSPIILSNSSGSLLGTFASRTAPAFGRTNMYTVYNGNLIAVDPSGSPNRWTFSNGSLVTAPVVSRGVVFVGSSSGTVYGVSTTSGTQVWSGTAGSTIVGPDEQNADVLVGMAIGGGLLVVPAANKLTVFG
jgi:outer membrane protein assembly factor BamB